MDGQFPVTEDYGCQPGYPLNQNICPPGQGFHRGVDYGYPEGTPVIVNGVQIGLSGSTGEVTGAHLHIGHWVNGKDVNPNRQGSHVNGGYVVRLVYNDPVNGNYVHIQDADGSYWVYLHLSRIDVQVNQVLNGDDMPYTDEQYNALKAKCEGYAEDWARQRYVLGGRDPASITQAERRLRLDMTVQQAGADLDRDLPIVASPYELMKDATKLKPGKYIVE
jgi:hypothetical protein